MHSEERSSVSNEAESRKGRVARRRERERATWAKVEWGTRSERRTAHGQEVPAYTDCRESGGVRLRRVL